MRKTARNKLQRALKLIEECRIDETERLHMRETAEASDALGSIDMQCDIDDMEDAEAALEKILEARPCV